MGHANDYVVDELLHDQVSLVLVKQGEEVRTFGRYANAVEKLHDGESCVGADLGLRVEEQGSEEGREDLNGEMRRFMVSLIIFLWHQLAVLVKAQP